MKRIVFTLLHSEGSYMLSRNFRLQRVGDLDWVLRNYDIGRVSLGIDELIVLNVSPEAGDQCEFLHHVERLTMECFIPVTIGGWLRSKDDVARCFAAGADKVLVNSAFFDDPEFCQATAATYGSQALVGAVDVVGDSGDQSSLRHRRLVRRQGLSQHIQRLIDCGAGEILIQSVEHDGTGGGLDLTLADIADSGPAPIIMMGGIGHANHVLAGLRHPRVDAVATANLFNFIGDALVLARRAAHSGGVELPLWSNSDLESLRGMLMSDSSTATRGAGDV